jgi:hypothetical protein
MLLDKPFVVSLSNHEPRHDAMSLIATLRQAQGERLFKTVF